MAGGIKEGINAKFFQVSRSFIHWLWLVSVYTILFNAYSFRRSYHVDLAIFCNDPYLILTCIFSYLCDDPSLSFVPGSGWKTQASRPGSNWKEVGEGNAPFYQMDVLPCRWFQFIDAKSSIPCILLGTRVISREQRGTKGNWLEAKYSHTERLQENHDNVWCARKERRGAQVKHIFIPEGRPRTVIATYLPVPACDVHCILDCFVLIVNIEE